jgi:WD40 repeat protein
VPRRESLLFLLAYLGLVGNLLVQGEPPVGEAKQKPAPPGKVVRTDLYGDPLPEGAIARLGTIRLRHKSDVFSAIFTPDGKSLIAADSELIRVYDPTTGARVRSFQGHRFGSEVLALSPNGKILAGIGGAASVSLWNLADGRLLREFGQRKEDENGNLVGLAFSPDSKTLATIGCRTGIQLWDSATGKRVRRLAGQDAGWCVAFSPDGKLLAAGGADALQLWDPATGKMVWQIKKDNIDIHAVAFAPDGKTLAAGEEADNILLVAPADGKELRHWAAGGSHSLAFSPDGKSLASGGDDGTIRFWDPLTGKKVRDLRGHLSAVCSVAFSPDGRSLTSGSHDRTVRLWEVSTGRERPAFDGHQDSVYHVAFSPDGKVLASGGRDDTVRLWDPERGKQLQLLPDYDTPFYSPDGKLLAATDRSGVIRLRDSATGKLVRSFEAHGEDTLAFHPDGRTFASTGSEPVIRVWETATGKERLHFTTEGKSKWMNSIAFSPDGKLLACGEEDEAIHLWDWAARREVRRFADSKKARCFAFAPDGSSLATGGDDGMIRFWRVKDGEERLHWKVDDCTIHALAFSPNGRFLATPREEEAAVSLWEVATGKELHRFVGHVGWVNALAFSPDGRRLASGSHDFTVLVWEVPASLEKDGILPSDPERCWKDLADDDPRVAYRAVWGLANMPAKTVPLLCERLRPVPGATQARIDRLIADLDDDDFAVRSKASAGLEELGEVTEPSLRKVLRGSPSPEVRQRAEKLIAKAAAPVPPAEQLRLLRALAVLEEIGTPEACKLLESLANAAPDARLTQEAGAILERLAKQPAKGQLPAVPRNKDEKR